MDNVTKKKKKKKEKNEEKKKKKKIRDYRPGGAGASQIKTFTSGRDGDSFFPIKIESMRRRDG